MRTGNRRGVRNLGRVPAGSARLAGRPKNRRHHGGAGNGAEGAFFRPAAQRRQKFRSALLPTPQFPQICSPDCGEGSSCGAVVCGARIFRCPGLTSTGPASCGTAVSPDGGAPAARDGTPAGSGACLDACPGSGPGGTGITGSCSVVTAGPGPVPDPAVVCFGRSSWAGPDPCCQTRYAPQLLQKLSPSSFRALHSPQISTVGSSRIGGVGCNSGHDLQGVGNVGRLHRADDALQPAEVDILPGRGVHADVQHHGCPPGQGRAGG